MFVNTTFWCVKSVSSQGGRASFGIAWRRGGGKKHQPALLGNDTVKGYPLLKHGGGSDRHHYMTFCLENE